MGVRNIRDVPTRTKFTRHAATSMFGMILSDPIIDLIRGQGNRREIRFIATQYCTGTYGTFKIQSQNVLVGHCSAAAAMMHECCCSSTRLTAQMHI